MRIIVNKQMLVIATNDYFEKATVVSTLFYLPYIK